MCSVEKTGLKKRPNIGVDLGGVDRGCAPPVRWVVLQKEKKNETRYKSFLSDAPPTKKNPGPAPVIESFRFKNEDEYQFVCLVIVRMRTCPWRVTQAEKSLSAAPRRRNFEKSPFHENEIYKDEFCTSISSLIIKKTFSSPSVSSIYKNFSLEHLKKPGKRKRKMVVFQLN